MAFHDWNHDGKKDWQDNFIEYQIYKDVTDDKNEKPQFTSNRKSSGGMSGCGALIITILSIIIAAAIVGFLFGGDISNVPDWLIVPLFIVIAAVVSVLMSLRW